MVNATPRPGRIIPGNDPIPNVERLGGPRGKSGRVRIISSPTGIRSPDRPAHIKSLYRLIYPGKRIEHKQIHINHQVVPYENTAKYLGMTLDDKLRWKPHVKKKQERTYTEIQKNVSISGSLFCPICI
jgi:hypothetical protein